MSEALNAWALWLRSTPISEAVRVYPWLWPACEILHFFGLSLLLGVAPRIPLAPLEALFPAMWIGFWVNALSGVALFVADATTKGTTRLFMTKLGIIAVAVVVIVLQRRTVYGRGPERAATSPQSRNAVARRADAMTVTPVGAPSLTRACRRLPSKSTAPSWSADLRIWTYSRKCWVGRS